MTLGNHSTSLAQCAKKRSVSPLGYPLLLPLLDQLPFPSEASTAPHEQTPCLRTLPPPNHLFANAVPQGSPGQEEVPEKEPEGAWAPKGLPEKAQPQPSQQVLPPGGRRDGHAAPGELHGRECPGKALEERRAPGGLGGWARAPRQEPRGLLPGSQRHRGYRKTHHQSRRSPLFFCSFIQCLCTQRAPLLCQAPCWAQGQQPRAKPGPAPALMQLTV